MEEKQGPWDKIAEAVAENILPIVGIVSVVILFSILALTGNL